MRRPYILILMALMLASCTITRGSGVTASEPRNVTGFDHIEVSGSATVDITIGSTWAVEVEADDNILPLITTKVTGSTLDIGTKSGTSFMTSNPVRVSITMPAVAGVGISGSGEVTANEIGDTQSLTVDISGSGKVTMAGTAEQLDVSVDGSGSFDGRRFQVATAVVSIAGSGTITVWATDRLDASISGSGSIRYVGTPGQLSTDVSGSGSIAPDNG